MAPPDGPKPALAFGARGVLKIIVRLSSSVVSSVLCVVRMLLILILLGSTVSDGNFFIFSTNSASSLSILLPSIL